MEQYQDIYSKGKLQQRGIRSCEPRYDALKTVFEKYTRPFTILDIGANFGYFSIRAAEEYGATSVMIQPAPQSTEILSKLCTENSHLNLIILNKKITTEELIELATCERVDIVLAMNIIHHLKKDWIKALDAILHLGKDIIFENPPSNDKGTCGKKTVKELNDYIKQLPQTILGEFTRHTDSKAKSKLLVLNGKNIPITKAYYKSPERLKIPFKIQDTYDSKIITKSGNKFKWTPGIKYNWIPGINLQTYIVLNGIYPTKEFIINKLYLKELNTDYMWNNTHGDISPWNIILNGDNLHLIDIEGKYDKTVRKLDQDGLDDTIKFLS